MTDRWLNYVLAMVVIVGLVAFAFYERPRLAEERAELLGQEVAELDDGEQPDEYRDPPEMRFMRVAAADEPDDLLDEHGVSASHPAAVEVGLAVLDAGGTAVDAAIATSYVLGVVEPFGSGPGGGGAMLVHHPGEEPLLYDYREMAPPSGQVPASNIGVPGFVAGMERIHTEHGSVELADLIEPAARLAEEGVEVSEYLHERLVAAAHRLPIHLAPRLFPDGRPIGAGEVLRQPEYAQALRRIQEEGADVIYNGELGAEIVEAVSGLEADDLVDYEVLELDPAVGHYAGYDVISAGAPMSGPTLVQLLQIAEHGGIGDLDLTSAEAHHLIAQSWRLALSERTLHIADPTVEDVDRDRFVDPDHTQALAERIPPDGFVEVEHIDVATSQETDTTHIVVVDRAGTMVSVTNTLSNFFGSGLPVSGFFLNDQLKNFSAEADSINLPAPGKRPRSFITPTILAVDGQPVLGIGSPGGRRIPTMLAQVLIRWAGHSQTLADAVDAPRFHLEGHALEVEEAPPRDVAADLAARGYEIVQDVPTTEYFGGIQALEVDHSERAIRGAADGRRPGSWESNGR